MFETLNDRFCPIFSHLGPPAWAVDHATAEKYGFQKYPKMEQLGRGTFTNSFRVKRYEKSAPGLFGPILRLAKVMEGARGQKWAFLRKICPP